MDMNARFPDAPMGAYCYIAGRFTLDSPVRRLTMAVNCFGPVMVWLNGENVFCSQCAEEVDRDLKKLFSVPLPAGENLFVIRVRKVGSGFGCVFGAEKDLADPKRYGLPGGETGVSGLCVECACYGAAGRLRRPGLRHD